MSDEIVKWIPAFAGMTKKIAGMTKKIAGMTKKIAGMTKKIAGMTLDCTYMKKYFLSIMKGQRKGFSAQLITWLLLPWSLVYGLGLFCHRNFYRLRGAYKAPKPVISIGNITVGGSGKTPLVIWLARNLQDKGIKSVILIRGYMPFKKIASSLRNAPRNDTVFPNNSDEADMLNEQIPYVPILAGADRVANIVKLDSRFRGNDKEGSGNDKFEKAVDVYIADDAFQHWPLRRDLNIVAIDAGNPFGNGHLLPAGILREPLSALKRAHVFVLTKTENLSGIQDLSSKLEKINPKALIVESRYKSARIVDVFDAGPKEENSLNDKRVVGFCAIGDPLSFESSLKNSGANVIQLFTYMDHHVYKKDEVQLMVKFCRLQESRILVTTHKDAVKLRIFKELFEGIRLVYIPIQLEITKGSDEFIQKVISVCRD
jgi:tetraacyldisaccharide 4'-kinase